MSTTEVKSERTGSRSPWVLEGPRPQEVMVGSAASLVGRATAMAAGTALRKQLNTFLPPAGGSGTPGDPGLFGPDSVIWRVHADASAIVGGTAAVTMQGLHPRAFAGFADHTDFNADPNGRLIRTAGFVAATTYGDRTEATAAVRHAHKMHKHVKGSMPDGRTYDAREPELAMWVHITLFAGIAAAYQRFGPHPLTDDEVDQYMAETAVIGKMFGLPDAPRSWAEMNDALESYLPLLSINYRAARGISYFRDPFGLPDAVRRLIKALWPGTVVSMAPICRTLMMQPLPSTREIALCRALVRALDAIQGNPEQLTRARERVARAAS